MFCSMDSSADSWGTLPEVNRDGFILQTNSRHSLGQSHLISSMANERSPDVNSKQLWKKKSPVHSKKRCVTCRLVWLIHMWHEARKISYSQSRCSSRRSSHWNWFDLTSTLEFFGDILEKWPFRIPHISIIAANHRRLLNAGRK
jgi:Pyruvate/2-oxoacid:ferredoxin oxidoreductase delta subunit